MQKKLIALAVAGLVAAPAFAQSNVTIFGIIDAAVESAKFSDAAGNLTRMISGGNNTNRLGFRGTEDLGGGLSANFLLETQANPDSGTQAGAVTGASSQFWNRSSTVGIASKNWGSLNLGRQYTPWFNAAAAADVFYVAGAGSSYTMVAGDTRMNNSIRWDSVNMNGFTASAIYGLGQNGDGTGIEGTTAADKNLGKEFGLKLSYANGPLSLNYGYDTQKTAVGPDVDTKRNQLNGSYDFKVVKLGLMYNTNKASGLLDDQVWGFTATMPVMGSDLVKLGYTNLNDKLPANRDAKLFALGYEHPMSKRTTLYATYAKMTNDAAANRSFLSGGGAVAAGFDPSSFQAGVKHMF